MKRYDNLWKDFLTFENFWQGYLDARRSKRYRQNVLIASYNIEKEIHLLLEQLANKSWKPHDFFVFETRSEVKRRLIHAPTFLDRVVHHALDLQIRNLFEKKFIYDSYANIKGKGSHKAVRRTQKYLRILHHTGRVYALQCDIHKYFESINKKILKKEVRRTICDKDILWLIDLIIDSYEETGIPIGALFSQLCANVYLNPFDHYVKEILHEKYYIRYVDDFIVLSNSKKHLANLKVALENYLHEKLHLSLNPKSHTYSEVQGIDFCGYRTWATHVLPRKRNVLAAKRRFSKMKFLHKHNIVTKKEIMPRVASFLGYMKHCNSKRTAMNALKYLSN